MNIRFTSALLALALPVLAQGDAASAPENLFYKAFYLEKGTRKTTLDQLVGPDKYLTRIRVVDGEDYGKLKLSLGSPLIVTTKSGVSVRYGP